MKDQIASVPYEVTFVVIAGCILAFVVFAARGRCFGLFEDDERLLDEDPEDEEGNESWTGGAALTTLLASMNLHRGRWRTLGMIDFKRLQVEPAAFASGAGGVLYRGTFLGRKVAIKALYSQMMADEMGTSSESLAEISREAALLVRVAHPNIVRLYGISRNERCSLPSLLLMFFCRVCGGVRCL